MFKRQVSLVGFARADRFLDDLTRVPRVLVFAGHILRAKLERMLLLWPGGAGLRAYSDVSIRALHAATRINRLWERQLDDARAADDCDISRVSLIVVRSTEHEA